MGIYTYTMRSAHKTIDGKVIHVADYAGKESWALGAKNSQINRLIGIAHATFERLGYKPDYFVHGGFDDGFHVFANPNGSVAYYDSQLDNAERFPCVGVLKRSGNSFTLLYRE